MRTKNLLVIILNSVLFIISCSNSNITEPEKEKTVYEIKKGTSSGNTWEQVYSFPTHLGKHTFYLLDISIDENGYIYAATSGGGIYKINPSRTGAEVLNNGLIKYIIETDTIYYVGAVLCNNNRIIAGSTNLDELGGIFISDNNGGDFFQSRIMWNKYSVVVSLFKSPSGDIFSGCYMEVYSSNDNGYSWQNETINTEGGFGYFYSFTFNKYGDIYGATRRGVYYSDSRKIQFKNIGLADEAVLGIDLNSKGWIYASTERGKMYISRDSANSWQQINNYPNYGGHCIYINKDDFIFAGTTNGIYRSKDNGDSWELVGCENQAVEKIIADSHGNLIAGTYGSNIYYSSQ